MEELLKIISEFSPLGVVALALVIILFLVRRKNGEAKMRNKIGDIYKLIDEFEANHIHELKDSLQRIEQKIERGFDRIELSLNENKELLMKLSYKKNDKRK